MIDDHPLSSVSVVLANGLPAVEFAHVLPCAQSSAGNVDLLGSTGLTFSGAFLVHPPSVSTDSMSLQNFYAAVLGNFTKLNTVLEETNTSLKRLSSGVQALAAELALARIEKWLDTYLHTHVDAVLVEVFSSAIGMDGALSKHGDGTMLVAMDTSWSMASAISAGKALTIPSRFPTASGQAKWLRVRTEFGQVPEVNISLPYRELTNLMHPTLTGMLMDMEREVVIGHDGDTRIEGYAFRLQPKSVSANPL